jgi:hypothetical protein
MRNQAGSAKTRCPPEARSPISTVASLKINIRREL